MAASAEAAFAPETVFAKKHQGVAVAFQVRLKDVTGRGTGKLDKGHTELPTFRALPDNCHKRAPAFYNTQNSIWKQCE